MHFSCTGLIFLPNKSLSNIISPSVYRRKLLLGTPHYDSFLVHKSWGEHLVVQLINDLSVVVPLRGAGMRFWQSAATRKEAVRKWDPQVFWSSKNRVIRTGVDRLNTNTMFFHWYLSSLVCFFLVAAPVQTTHGYNFFSWNSLSSKAATVFKRNWRLLFSPEATGWKIRLIAAPKSGGKLLIHPNWTLN